MTDIVERLRFRADENYEMLGNIHEPLLEAADEIERLRAALRGANRYLPYWRPRTALARQVKLETLAMIRATLEGRT